MGFVAPPGHGKNHLMAYRFCAAHRVVVFNTCGSYSNVRGENKNPLAGFVFVYSIPALIEVLRKAGGGPVRVCFTPVGEEDMTEVFHDFCRLMMAFKNVVLAIDEVWNFHGPSFLPPVQKQVFLQWRHYGFTVMWAAQQPQLVNSTVRSVSTESYVGKFTDKLDIDAVARCKVKDPQAVALLSKLPSFQFIHQFESGEWKIEQAPAR
jgi:Zonular occludens toxin (Zot)